MPRTAASKAYGTVSPEQQKQMSGLEFVEGLATGKLPLNTMAQTLGYDVSEATKGRVVVIAIPDATHLNPAGTVHGGLAATMLDTWHGACHSLDSRKRPRFNDTRIQDLAGTADHAGDRPYQSRGHCPELRPPHRHRRRPHHRPARAFARTRHDHLPDLCDLSFAH